MRLNKHFLILFFLMMPFLISNNILGQNTKSYLITKRYLNFPIQNTQDHENQICTQKKVFENIHCSLLFDNDFTPEFM